MLAADEDGDRATKFFKARLYSWEWGGAEWVRVFYFALRRWWDELQPGSLEP